MKQMSWDAAIELLPVAEIMPTVSGSLLNLHIVNSPKVSAGATFLFVANLNKYVD